MLSLGSLIWISIRPLIRLILTASFGFAITKADIFPLSAARGAGQIMINITLPCLMFSKIVPAFTPENISALGPLITVAVIYTIIGFLQAWIVKQTFWVPHRFRYGILCAGTFANYSDVPTAVIMSITGSQPFNGAADQNLSVAYIAAFVLVFFIGLFPLGGFRLVEMDHVGPEVEDEDIKLAVSKRRQWIVRAVIKGLRFITMQNKRSPKPQDIESSLEKREEEIEGQANNMEEAQLSGQTSPRRGMKHVSFYPDDATVVPTEQSPSQNCSATPSRINSPAPSDMRLGSSSISQSSVYKAMESTGKDETSDNLPTIKSNKASFKARIPRLLRTMLRSFMMPPSITIIAAFIIAIITPLKALFTPVPNSHIPNAPDGQPPLAFILDTATFVGAASIPIGLICLGSAIARMKVSRSSLSSLPLGAIAWLSILKMLLTPVLGVLIVEGLVSTRFIDPDDKVLRFVCVFFSCVPTATSQVFLTQVYSATGSAEPLPAFLLPQYIIMFFSMTILTAYTLSMLF